MRAYIAGITVALTLAFTPVAAEAQGNKGTVPDRVEGVTTVSPAEAKALWDRDVKFVDVRGPLYDEGHVPGAVQLNYIVGFNEENLKKIAKLGDEIVIYCGGLK